VEASQSMIRIVGLSATLPNYKDVASFLGVSPESGLFHFDASYRPVPLDMQFIGVSERKIMAAKGIMDEICYQKVLPFHPCPAGPTLSLTPPSPGSL
jgi:replicative superfamily II helicase